MDPEKKRLSWSRLPPAYKKSVYIATGAFAGFVALVGLYVLIMSGKTLQSWHDRTPRGYSVIVAETAASTSSAQTDFVGAPLPPNLERAVPATNAALSFAIVMTDLGLNEAMTDVALKDLPRSVSVAFSPYSSDLEQKSKAAKDQGREVLALIPMEPNTFPKDDPGPRALNVSADPATNSFNLKWMIDRVPGATGAMNSFGSRFVTDRTRLGAMFMYLREKNLYFVEQLDNSESVAAAGARDQSVPYVLSRIVIDDVPTEENIRKNLQTLQVMARENGHVIAVARPYPITINMLKSWMPLMTEKGAQFVSPGNFVTK